MRKITYILVGSFIILVGLGIYQYVCAYDGKLHVIFCSVGQGDAIVIKTPEGKFVMVDGGPDRSVLECLARHLPFWQRRIDQILLTHPHADHFFGFFSVFERYTVNSFVTEAPMNDTAGYRELRAQIKEKRIPYSEIFAGDRLQIQNVSLQILYPTREYLDHSSPNGLIGETKELASLMTEITYGRFIILLTGDSQTEAMKTVLDSLPEQVNVLQSPHHGSRTGVDKDVIVAIHPQLAVISVGAHNRYGHPHKEVLELYQNAHIPVIRTDQQGDVEIVSNGEEWQLVH